MARELKQMIVKELTGRYEGMDRCVVVDLTGLKSTALGQIRTELRKQNITLSVVKNSLAIKAFSQMGLDDLGVLLKGPSALAVGEKDALSLVKVMVACANKNKIVIRGSLAEGKVFAQAQTVKYSKTPDKKTLQAMMLGTMMAPVSSLARLLAELVKRSEGAPAAVVEVASEVAPASAPESAEEKPQA